MPVIQHLIVDEFGSFVAKKSGRLRVTCKGEKRGDAPLMHLETVLISGRGVSLSSDAVAACAEQGVPIHFLDSRGKPVGSLYSAGLAATVQTRRAQIEARQDSRGLRVALAVAEGKLSNQNNLLKYMAKYRKTKQPDVYRAVRLLADEVVDHIAELERLRAETVPSPVGCVTVDDVRGQILSIEGRGSQRYWQGVGKLLLADVKWPGRRTQGASDPLNSALNYGYGILYSQVERALVLAGLDPYAGFLHTDRPGKSALVYDMVEEFRQTVVDRTVLAVFNRGAAVELDSRGRLTEKSRRSLAQKVLTRLEAQERYEDKRHPLRNIVQMQARRLASFLREERDAYRPFVSSW